MKIGEAAAAAGLPAKTIRYYEGLGLVSRPRRRTNGYRDFSDRDIDRLRFIAGMRAVGLSLKDVGKLAEMREKGKAPCEALLTVLEERTTALESEISRLLATRNALLALQEKGAGMRRDDVGGIDCVCSLVKTYR